MGVNPTPSNFKTFTFDGQNSRSYGVYITGEGVFNAPERAIEMISIAGRNGAYALDQGHFENIEVTYPAGIFADTEADFAQAISDLRNLLCSKTGYVRLEDDYNPDEYRMAIYKSGLEVTHDMLINGEFDIVFDCKPQRFLTSGETAVTLTSGNAVTNPTLFESHPMFEVWGYGDIDIGGQEVKVVSEAIGPYLAYANGGSASGYNNSYSFTIDTEFANSADTITVSGVQYLRRLSIGSANIASVSFTNVTSPFELSASAITGNYFMARCVINSATFAYGTSQTLSSTATVTITDTNNATYTSTYATTLQYDGSDSVTMTLTTSAPSPGGSYSSVVPTFRTGDWYIDSTQSALGQPLYIDLDIGEAYKIVNDSAVSVNNAVQIPAELPTLPSGNTTITFDNTFTKVQIIPRWWKV